MSRRASASIASSRARLALACARAASYGRGSMTAISWPFLTRSPSLKLTFSMMPVICDFTVTVVSAVTLPIPGMRTVMSPFCTVATDTATALLRLKKPVGRTLAAFCCLARCRNQAPPTTSRITMTMSIRCRRRNAQGPVGVVAMVSGSDSFSTSSPQFEKSSGSPTAGTRAPDSEVANSNGRVEFQCIARCHPSPRPADYHAGSHGLRNRMFAINELPSRGHRLHLAVLKQAF